MNRGAAGAGAETGVEVTAVEVARAGVGVEVEAPNVKREADVAADVVADPKDEVVVAALPNLNVVGADVETGAVIPNPPNSGALSTVFFGADASGVGVLPKTKGEDPLDDPSSVFPNKGKPEGAGVTTALFTSAVLTSTVSVLDSKLEMGLVGEEMTVVEAMEVEEAPILVDVERLKTWDPKLGVDLGWESFSDGSGILKLTSGAIVFLDTSAGPPNEKLSFFAGSALDPKLNGFGATSFWSATAEVDFPDASGGRIPNLNPVVFSVSLLGSVEEPNLNPADSAAGLAGSTEEPNLNPAVSLEGLAGSTEEPNLNPADSPAGLTGSSEVPNLNPVASLEGLEDALEDSTETPNLKPVGSAEGLLVSVVDPNLNPVDSGLLTSTEVPNLNPPVDSGLSSPVVGLTPNFNSLSGAFFSAGTPNLKADIAGETVGFDPGRGVSQEVH